uniref:Putative scp-like extracellular protein n=1 Tax=Anopheles braziliensis TaxID=58242 RepID=A0A2M3ZF87_9DIPT
MEVCCLKMASRCRPTRSIKDITQLSSAGSSHDCGALSRVVMVRKTDQRVINHKGSQKDPLCEVITMETIQTYKGHKPDRTVVFKEKFDLTGNDMSKSLSTGKLAVGSPRLSISPLRTILTTSAELERTRSATPTSASDRNNNSMLGTAPVATKPASPKERPSSVKQSLAGGGWRPKSLDRSNNNIAGGSPRNYQKSPSIGTLRQRSPGSFSGSQSSLRSSSLYGEFERECLKAHNEYRTRHGVLPLKLSKRLCRYAEEWAKVIAARGVLVHRSNSQYGENIFCSWSSSNTNVTVSGREPVENWYSEIDIHVFGKEPATLKTGHFTQVVWKDSRELGVGVARNRSGQVFVVANYDPPGNYIGSFAKNVPPVGGFEVPKIIVDKPASVNSTPTAGALKSSVSVRPRPTDGAKAEKHVRIVDENDPDQFDEFAVGMLKHHNEYRKRHGVPELILHKELVRDAQQWAEILARDDRFTYRQNSKYGENLYCLWSSDRNARPNARDVCRSWYEEVKQYTFTTEPRGAVKGGQFTQMVWKGTQELGVGISQTRSGKVIVVCTYYPRGNVVGQFMANVNKAR